DRRLCDPERHVRHLADAHLRRCRIRVQEVELPAGAAHAGARAREPRRGLLPPRHDRRGRGSARVLVQSPGRLDRHAGAGAPVLASDIEPVRQGSQSCPRSAPAGLRSKHAEIREIDMPGLKRLLSIAAVAVSGALLLSATPSAAQNWPQRSVRFILPLGPGSGVDISARLFADRLSARWGQPVVLEHRAGAAPMIAISAVISAADDHVLLFAPTSSYTAPPFLHEKLPYEWRDVVPIVRVSNTIVVIAVPASSPVKTVADFINMVKERPGTVNFNT